MDDSQYKNPRFSPLAAELTRRMESIGLTQKELALKAGLNETAVRDIRRGRSKHPRHDTIEKLAVALNCSIMALLAPGSSDSLEFSGNNSNENLSGRLQKTTVSIDDIVSLPLFDCATKVPYPLDATKSRMRWPLPKLLVEELCGGNGSRLSAIIIRGNSMNPTLMDSDLAILDIKIHNVTRDGIYIIHHSGGLVARRLTIGTSDDLVNVTCDNTDFAKPEMVSPNMLAIAGRVIWIGQKT